MSPLRDWAPNGASDIGTRLRAVCAFPSNIAAAALSPRIGMTVAPTEWGGNGLKCEIASAAAAVRRTASS
jgi:hypothetical protein